jgi:uncharacterized protein (TIGR04255 family)
MAEPRPLARPPIVEALVDFRVAVAAPVDASKFESLRDELAARFPTAEQKQRVGSQLTIEAGKVASATTQVVAVGLFFRSADEKRIAQFRTDGFTVNHLAPYSSGDALLTDALDLWPLYQTIAKPQAVTRIALRYINRLELPYRPGDDFTRFLTTPPDLPVPAPRTVSSFLSRIVAHESPATVIVTQRLEGVPGNGPPTVLIDIDAFQDGQLPSSRHDLAERFQQLRGLKNRTFFALLTDEAVGLYL